MARHSVDITVSATGDFTYSPPRMPAVRGDQIEWTCNQPKFALHLGEISPCDHRRFRTSSGKLSVTVRNDAPIQVYKYFVAVDVNGQIFTDDPEIIVWR